MSEAPHLRVSPTVAIAAMLSVLLAGAGGTWLLMRNGHELPNAEASRASEAPAVRPASSIAQPDAVVTLTKDAVDRAGIVVAAVSLETGTNGLRVPGVVEPNAYRQVSVTPLVGGRVVGVSARLGDHVKKGQRIAQVYSPELAEARTRYIAAKAMLEAHDRELQRTQKLVEIGAASRQELERIHAEHAAQTAEVESARSRLELLGAAPDEAASSRSQASATTNVPAPIDGVVTERLANVGLNVDPATKLFTIVDLSNVWIVADVYERDLQRVRPGVRATITTTAFPDRPLEGKVSFIDPQLNTATRTAKIRVEVANPRGELRPGMYTDVTIDSASGTPILAVPKEAVQSVGGRQVVYVASSKDGVKFTEREVRLGRTVGDHIEVLSGLSAGDNVVSKGSFSVRAEVERLGLRGPQSSPAAARPADGGSSSAGVQTARVAVTEKGFEPDRVSLRAGTPARLTFIRTTDKTCGTEVEFPTLSIKRALPLNEPVLIEFTPSKAGQLAFACGMNMLKGVVVID